MKKEVVSPRSPRTEVLAPGAAARTLWTGLGVGVHPGQDPRGPVCRLMAVRPSSVLTALQRLPGRDSLNSTSPGWPRERG